MELSVWPESEATQHLPVKLHLSRAFSKGTATPHPDFGDRMPILAFESRPSAVFWGILVRMANIVQQTY